MFGPFKTGLLRVVPRGSIKLSDRFFEEGTVLSIHP